MVFSNSTSNKMSLHPNTAIRLPVDKLRRTGLQILAILWPNPIILFSNR